MIIDFLVIGGGISGASVAFELADKGSVLVIEAETSVGYHSTGRSAALFTRYYGGPVVRRINAVSAAFFNAPPQGFCDNPLLTPRGSLTIAPPGSEALLAPLLALSEPGDEIFQVAPQDALERAPFLRLERVAAALYERNVADIDVATLHQSYLKGLRIRGGTVITGQPVTAMIRTTGGWEVATATSTHAARIVVNAAGAWAGEVAAMAGAIDIGLVPMRRTGIIIDPPAGLIVPSLPAVDFADCDAYIKPEAGKIMASLGDATPTAPQDAQPDEMDVAVLADWIGRETMIDVKRIPHQWAGLRSFVEDEAPVVGFDPIAKNFVWLAGQGGYGIMMAPALAVAAAKICVDGRIPDAMREAGVTPFELSPDRLMQ